LLEELLRENSAAGAVAGNSSHTSATRVEFLTV
jgi:hypothetical protein